MHDDLVRTMSTFTFHHCLGAGKGRHTLRHDAFVFWLIFPYQPGMRFGVVQAAIDGLVDKWKSALRPVFGPSFRVKIGFRNGWPNLMNRIRN